ncbi:putative bacteriophage protein [Thioalkalivibrio sulfidiphilus HL-EbGr7]|uniref:Putative bacteriophage protein n=1 Tax=Thioalkalivibrio sulfidiphilus (strain HL-EbGR7) TaxID=396588 RepID=B8GS22_THISH|nr:DUF3486 family protein [Thioalkalivibrio sulfidiphilus]ACL72726.1 putative bacteriophage protein [Thioalkalivibrio sulfidiphilus HL-EbGr7]
MPKRSKVFELPQDVREELNEKLVATGFQGYEALAGWLAERGFQVSRSSVQRYGSELQAEFEAAMGDVRKTTEMAKAFTEGDDDAKGSLVDATARIVQEQLLRITIALRKAEHEPEKAAKYMASVTHALADIGRMSLGQKKWAREVRREVAQEAADKAAEVAKRGGLSAEVVNDLRRELLGIAK